MEQFIVGGFYEEQIKSAVKNRLKLVLHFLEKSPTFWYHWFCL
jgi:hypothetical protein